MLRWSPTMKAKGVAERLDVGDVVEAVPARVKV